MIELYTGPNCPGCTGAKEMLEEADLDYIERDVDRPENLTRLQNMGVMQIPCVKWSNGEVTAGFKRQEFEAQIRREQG